MTRLMRRKDVRTARNGYRRKQTPTHTVRSVGKMQQLGPDREKALQVEQHNRPVRSEPDRFHFLLQPFSVYRSKRQFLSAFFLFVGQTENESVDPVSVSGCDFGSRSRRFSKLDFFEGPSLAFAHLILTGTSSSACRSIHAITSSHVGSITAAFGSSSSGQANDGALPTRGTARPLRGMASLRGAASLRGGPARSASGSGASMVPSRSSYASTAPGAPGTAGPASGVRMQFRPVMPQRRKASESPAPTSSTAAESASARRFRHHRR